MTSPFTRERLQSWVGDFCHSENVRTLPSAVERVAADVLQRWLEAACARRDVEPEELEIGDLREALLGTIALLDLGAAHAHVPDLARLFLADLEQQGRLEAGRELGLQILGAREKYALAAAGQVETLRRPGPKIGRNEPCPCGSGKKYKACCLRAGA